jgi:hypothetical protein
MKTPALLITMLSSALLSSAGDDTSLQNKLGAAVQETLQHFSEKKLQTNQLAATVIDLTEPALPKRAAFRGDVPIYPASVVKLFYLVATHDWLERGRISDTPELRRALRDMIVDSYNEATHYVLDALTDTTSGPELSPDQRANWEFKRNVVNRYFAGLGYSAINVNQKPWCEGPYGRDRLFVGEHYENRNALTTDATARLLASIATGAAISPARSKEMLELLRRDPSSKSIDPDDQAHGFSALGLPNGTRLWSKAGWTSETRHDAIYIELLDGRKLVIVTFTVGHANDREIIPAFVRAFLTKN